MTVAPRDPLTPKRIVDAAVQVADEGGVRALTMRRIAGSLGVEAMALYHHVPNKRTILDGVVDAVFEEMGLPEQTPDWRTSIADHAWVARRAISRHRWILAMIESGDHVGPGRLRRHNALLGVLLDAGFSPADAIQASSLLDSYIHGFALQEDQQQRSSGASVTEAAEGLMDSLPVGLSHLETIASFVAGGGGPSYDDTFLRGLSIILDGLARCLQSEREQP